LREACDRVKKDFILSRLILTDESFHQWGFDKPVIGVAALNPHAGENGMFGREEIEEITRPSKRRQDWASMPRAVPRRFYLQPRHQRGI